MPPERSRHGRLAQPVHQSSQEQDTRNESILSQQQKPLRSIEELIEHPERLSGSPRSSRRDGDSRRNAVFFSHEASPPRYSEDKDAVGRAQDEEIARLLAENLELYNGHKYFSSIEKNLSECDPSLVPKPLFFDPEDRQIVIPRRSASTVPKDKWRQSPLVLQEIDSTIQTPNDGQADRRIHSRGISAAPQPTPLGKPKRLSRRSLSSPSKPEWYDLPRKESERLTQDALQYSEVSPESNENSEDSVIWRIGSSLRPTHLIEQLSPAKRFSKSPRALLFSSSPVAHGDKQAGTTCGTDTSQRYSGQSRFALPRGEAWTIRNAIDDSTTNAPTDPFAADPSTIGGLALRSGPWSDYLRPFPREMTKVMLTDMIKEGWFEVGDTWIYFRLVKTSKEDVYLNKELQLCKIGQDGTLTIAIPKGPLRKITESQHQVDRKPIPPPHGGYGTPFPDSPTLPINSSNVTLLRHSIRARRQQVNSYDTDSITLFEQPTTPRSGTAVEGIASTITRDDSALTPKNRFMGTDLARSASVRTAPTYGPRPQPPKRRIPLPVPSNEAVMVDIKLLQDLERRIFELDGRVAGSRRYEVGSNIWKQVRCLRGNRDLGTLWDMRQECAKEWKKTGK